MTEPSDDLAWVEEHAVAVHENQIFRIEQRRMRRAKAMADCADFFVIDTGSWVNIVALTPADELVMIEQWRHAVRRTTLEIPGGCIDPGEDPLTAAKRELLEETGFHADAWYALGTIDPNPAIMTNTCHTFLALDARKIAEPEFDETEDCRLALQPFATVPALVAGGRVTHALVVVALHYERLRRDGVHHPRRV